MDKPTSNVNYNHDKTRKGDKNAKRKTAQLHSLSGVTGTTGGA